MESVTKKSIEELYDERNLETWRNSYESLTALGKASTAKPNVASQVHYIDGIQPIEYMQSRMSPPQFCGYLEGNIIKYISRYHLKDGIKDLEKAKVYLNWLCEFKSTGSITIESKT
mgnify:CR=1 FL=1